MLISNPSAARPNTLSVMQNPCFKLVEIRRDHESIYEPMTRNDVKREVGLAASFCTAGTKCSTTGIRCTGLCKWEGGCVNNYDA